MGAGSSEVMLFRFKERPISVAYSFDMTDDMLYGEPALYGRLRQYSCKIYSVIEVF